MLLNKTLEPFKSRPGLFDQRVLHTLSSRSLQERHDVRLTRYVRAGREQIGGFDQLEKLPTQLHIHSEGSLQIGCPGNVAGQGSNDGCGCGAEVLQDRHGFFPENIWLGYDGFFHITDSA